MNIHKTLKDRTSMNNIFPNVHFSNIKDLANNLGSGIVVESNGKLNTANPNYMGNWVSNNEYHPNDVVRYVAETIFSNIKTYTIYLFKSLTTHNSTTTPDLDTTNWVELYSEQKEARYEYDVKVSAVSTSDFSDSISLIFSFKFVSSYRFTDNNITYTQLMNALPFNFELCASGFVCPNIAHSGGSVITASRYNGSDLMAVFCQTFSSDSPFNISPSDFTDTSETCDSHNTSVYITNIKEVTKL